MTILPDLFPFAYIPGWYAQLDELVELNRPEPWRLWEPVLNKKPRHSHLREIYTRNLQETGFDIAESRQKSENQMPER